MWAWVGTTDPSGFWYLFWSGIFPDVTIPPTIVIALYAGWRRHNCETQGCRRFGRHEWLDPSTGQSHRLCRHCHPLGHLTASGIKETHNEYASYTSGSPINAPKS